MNHLSPQDIEAESMRIIDREAGSHSFSEDEWTIVRRIIHATADFEVMKTIRFHPQAIAAGIAAMKQGNPVYTDTQMLKAAIGGKLQEQYGCSAVCLVADKEVQSVSKASGITRSAAAMQAAAALLQNGIVAIGNAPTALFEAIRLCQEAVMSPALIIGMPVVFVGAAESKQALLESGLVSITLLGRKGGTPAAVATINALMQLAGGR
ncbi:MAG: precorrin-8X methylmutase [Proteobacteria bacterium]|nr:precorrin-8X methylmutase [Pseudomonadota bacterium]